MRDFKTHTLDVPGAVLHYEVRDAVEPSGEPVLLLVGSPMGAEGFAALAERLPERTIVTYDPRGVGESRKTGEPGTSTPEQHADDLHRIIDAIGGGPVDLFASSGGAVNALELVARHPGQVRTLVAHEPPAVQVLPDREAALAAIKGISRTYERQGFGPAMAQFITIVGLKGEIPADFADQPAPDPAMFGLPAEDDGSRDDALVGQNLISCTHHEHDFAALRAASTRIVIAVGAESEGEMAYRGGIGVAERIGVEPVTFPSNHGGFLDDTFGMPGDPDGFAVKLREVLAG
ncbi:putative hydrolase [Nonomuraea coxensis DSM 45129]|uniref:Hydrolase n=1 Tax=Nonomuraea coxensis DSM 45129 TaxID=1122611 RepID=A0ABX8U5H4_9ACTN|nr:alpha/beta hydrolase [Nonomuraea coxensis]QYC42369.1 putative hydrolase [Nonomuraea coxensis DSM 45129]